MLFWASYSTCFTMICHLEADDHKENTNIANTHANWHVQTGGTSGKGIDVGITGSLINLPGHHVAHHWLTTRSCSTVTRIHTTHEHTRHHSFMQSECYIPKSHKHTAVVRIHTLEIALFPAYSNALLLAGFICMRRAAASREEYEIQIHVPKACITVHIISEAASAWLLKGQTMDIFIEHHRCQTDVQKV
jgi:hypothetical protein